LLQNAFPDGATQLLVCLQRWQAKYTTLRSTKRLSPRYLFFPAFALYMAKTAGLTRCLTCKEVPEEVLISEEGVRFSAIAYTEVVLGRSQPQLVIYVALRQQEVASDAHRRVAEALVHETWEYIRGETHSHSVAAEMLLTVLDAQDATHQLPGALSWLPAWMPRCFLFSVT
jgi:hypothetical protein